MKLYIECQMGASGDMLMAALYELLPDKEFFRKRMDSLALPGVTIGYEKSIKCGITGTHISVNIGGIEEISDDVHTHDHDHAHDHTNDHNHKDHAHDHNHAHDHDHHHTHDHNHHHDTHRYDYKEIINLIQNLDLPDKVKENALAVYNIIGEAEAEVHGTTLDVVHLHEIGSLDAVVDVVGCAVLIDMLGVEKITVSPVHVGYGMVRCDHGILPVPAPAAAQILKDIPIYSGRIEGELCTPTGAALLKRFATAFGPKPVMTINKIGYGMGTKDFEAANCLRAYLYDDANHKDTDNKETNPKDANHKDTIYEISCNLDDMTPEAIGAAFEILLDNGALDVYTTPIMMKKNRSAVTLTILCKEDKQNTLSGLMLKHTTTLGIRITKLDRLVLERTIKTVATKYGNIRVKYAKGFDTEKYKPEYDDVMTAAKKHNVTFREVYETCISKMKNGH